MSEDYTVTVTTGYGTTPSYTREFTEAALAAEAQAEMERDAAQAALREAMGELRQVCTILGGPDFEKSAITLGEAVRLAVDLRDLACRLEGEVARLREALEGADWIIGKMKGSESLALVHGFRYSGEDSIQGAIYRRMIDAALAREVRE